jgi:hypothetical protein
MIKDIYPVYKPAFEDLLLKNNYALSINTYKKFIHNDYCIHIDKNDNLCGRKKLKGKKYCCRHLRKEVIYICNFKGCRRRTQKYKMCYIHRKIPDTPLPLVNDEELIFFGNNIYNCKIFNKNVKIVIKDYIYDGSHSNTSNICDIIIYKKDDFLNNILNSSKRKIIEIINKYKINETFLYYLLSFLSEIHKNDKRMSDLQKMDINKYINEMVTIPINEEILYNIALKHKYYYHFIPRGRNIFECSKMSENAKNYKLIIYNKYGYEAINKYTKEKLKRYKKNKKKNIRRKIKNGTINENICKNDKIVSDLQKDYKEYFYEINGNPKNCYECNKNNNITKLYYLHLNNIYESYTCNFCNMSAEYIQGFGIRNNK